MNYYSRKPSRHAQIFGVVLRGLFGREAAHPRVPQSLLEECCGRAALSTTRPRSFCRSWPAIACGIALLLLPSHPLRSEEKPKAGSVRVYRFDSLDIEGHVKTPRLMYFLNRIRNKFRSFRLPEPKFIERVNETKNADFL